MLVPSHVFRKYPLLYSKLEAGEGLCLIIPSINTFNQVLMTGPIAQFITKPQLFLGFIKSSGGVVVWLRPYQGSVSLTLSFPSYYEEVSIKPQLFPIHLLLPSPIL